MLNYKSFDKERLAAFMRGYGFEGVDDDAFVRMVLILEVMVFNLLNNVRQLSKSLDVKTIGKAHFEAVLQIVHDVRTAKQRSGPTAATTSSGHSRSRGQRGGTVLPAEYFGTDSGRYCADVSAHEQSAFADGMSRAPIQLNLHSQSGGTVLPAEYFGTDSGRYFADVSAHEQSAFADGMSRAAFHLNLHSPGQSGGTVLPSEYFGNDSGRYFADVSAQEQSAFADGLSRAAINIHAGGAAAGAAPFIGTSNIKFMIEAYQKEKRASFKVSRTAYAIVATCLQQNLERFAAACKAVKQARRLKRSQLTLAIVTKALQDGEQFRHMDYSWKRR